MVKLSNNVDSTYILLFPALLNKNKEVVVEDNDVESTMLSLKPGFHIVVTMAEHACDHVLNRVLKLLIYRLQIFLVNLNTCDH